MHTVILISALCVSQTAGAQTQQGLVERFREQISVVDRTKVLLDWGYFHGNDGIEALISKMPVGVISEADRLRVINTFISDLKKRRELLKGEGGGLFEQSRVDEVVSVAYFNDIKKIVEAPGYGKWVKEFVSDFDYNIFVDYVKLEEVSRPQRIVSVTFGGVQPGFTIRLYFFFRMTETDWAIDFLLPQIEFPETAPA